MLLDPGIQEAESDETGQLSQSPSRGARMEEAGWRRGSRQTCRALRLLLCDSRDLALEDYSPAAETWAAKIRNTRRRELRRCGLPCLLPEPEVQRLELLGKPRARSR